MPFGVRLKGGAMMRWFAPLCSVALCLAVSMVSTPVAHAEPELTTGGMDLRLHRPAVDSRGHITVNGTDILPDRKYSFGLTLDAGFGILRYRGFETDETRQVSSDGVNRESRIVRQAFTGTLHFNYGLFGRLVLGLQLPIQVFRGEAVQVPGYYNDDNNTVSGLSEEGLGDLSLHAKVRILNAARRKGVGLAAVLRVPVSDR